MITVLLIICLVVELPATIRFLQFFRHRANPDFVESLIFRDYHQNTPTPLHRLAYSWQATNVSMRAMEMLRANTYGATIDSTSHCSPHIVLIIGESFNKHHSSLYGYTLATTPLQQQRMENGELFPFTDAVTPWNITSNAILHLFAVGPYDSDGTLAHRILFPILFQRAGYEVTFFSNQFRIKGVFSGATSVAGNFFLSDKEMSDSLFTYRNSRFSQKDMGIVHQLSEYYAEKTITPFTLDIIHLKGQHFDYSQRYPSEEAFFSVEDYADRNLDRQSMLTVMHYDNATRYNDRVLDSLLLFYESMEAIVVFIPDHGEEVYDDLPVQGRLFQKPDFYQARNEYEVPLWIWCSQSYSELHPDIVALIKDATGRPLMSDNIPQLLLYLADINSQWTSEEQNVLSTSYHKNRRIIGGEVDYDSIVTND
ncbi:MAG: phosphoethanolamine transferase [Bacteroidales bacterium]|nr:phosphoethanolamine transferase [Bacteroidales bacterium]